MIWKSEDEQSEYHDPDGWDEREEAYLKSIGFLAFLSGCKPHEIFEGNWNETILFDLKCSNLVWASLIEMMGGGTGVPYQNNGYY